MAHYATWKPFPQYSDREEVQMLTSPRPIIVPDGEWEATHMHFLGFGHALDIATGCSECVDDIYEILSACARAHGLKRLP